jgi:hypothetical protein
MRALNLEIFASCEGRRVSRRRIRGWPRAEAVATFAT